MKWLRRLHIDLPSVRAGSVGAYVLAVILAVLAFAVSLILDPRLGGVQFITLLSAVTITTVFGGARAGVLCLVVSAVAASIDVIPPVYRAGWVEIVCFLAVAALHVLLVAALREAIRRHRTRAAELEDRVWKTAEELAQAEASLAQAQKLEVLGRLSGGIAHDFNNMLAVVMSGISIVKDRIDRNDREAHKAIQQALEGVRSSAELVRSLQTISRKHPLFPESTDVNRLLTRMSAVLARTLGEGIAVRYIGGCEVWPAFVDPHQLETAILNLALNARDAMPDGGTLTLEVGNSPSVTGDSGGDSSGHVLVCVSDTGIGMTPEMTARAVEPFFTTKEPGKGTGLGLSQVHGFVQQSGGHMEIESTRGRGTKVKLYLPRAQTRPTTIRPAVGVAHESLPRARDGETVLVVEDREEVRQASVAAFEQLGYEVVEAPGGIEALAMLKQAPFIALLFSDVMMPGMNGYELARLAQASNPRLKVLLTTGLDGVSAAYPRGAGWPILPKPFTLDELAWKVRNLLDELETSQVGA